MLNNYFSDPPVLPPKEIEEFNEHLNPSKDHIKIKIHEVEGVWDWLDRVTLCLRCQDELKGHEKTWARKYCTRQEKEDFWHFYLHGVVRFGLDRAILKIDRQFERRRVY